MRTQDYKEIIAMRELIRSQKLKKEAPPIHAYFRSIIKFTTLSDIPRTIAP